MVFFCNCRLWLLRLGLQNSQSYVTCKIVGRRAGKKEFWQKLKSACVFVFFFLFSIPVFCPCFLLSCGTVVKQLKDKPRASETIGTKWSWLRRVSTKRTQSRVQLRAKRRANFRNLCRLPFFFPFSLFFARILFGFQWYIDCESLSVYFRS